MKKLLKTLFLILGLVFSVTAMTACSDDDEGGLSGVYGCKTDDDGYGNVYHFINGNTVHFYGYAHYGRSYGDGISYPTTEQIGSSNWYAYDNDDCSTYTYEVDGNKVIIPIKGKILTISGNTLTEDGGRTFIKD